MGSTGWVWDDLRNRLVCFCPGPALLPRVFGLILQLYSLQFYTSIPGGTNQNSELNEDVLFSLDTLCVLSSFSVIGPSVFSIINASLALGQVPTQLKSTVIHPLLEKSNFDHFCYNSFRQTCVYKLPFLAKLVVEQLSIRFLTSFCQAFVVYTLQSFREMFRVACYLFYRGPQGSVSGPMLFLLCLLPL